jgi:hypothetical protein
VDISPPSSRSKRKRIKKPAEADSKLSNLHLLDLLLDPEDRGKMFLRNKQALSELHSDTTQKTILYKVTTVKSSNPIFILPFYLHLGLLIGRTYHNDIYLIIIMATTVFQNSKLLAYCISTFRNCLKYFT